MQMERNVLEKIKQNDAEMMSYYLKSLHTTFDVKFFFIGYKNKWPHWDTTVQLYRYKTIWCSKKKRFKKNKKENKIKIASEHSHNNTAGKYESLGLENNYYQTSRSFRYTGVKRQ